MLVAQSEAAFVARAALIEAGENKARQRITGMRADIAALDEQLPAVQHQLAVARDATHTIALLVDRDLAPCPRLVDLVEQEACFAVDLAFSERWGRCPGQAGTGRTRRPR